MTQPQAHQEQLFDITETPDAKHDTPRWKLDEQTRRLGRRRLAAVRDELKKHPAPDFEHKTRRPVPEHDGTRRDTSYVTKGYITKGYRNAA